MTDNKKKKNGRATLWLGLLLAVLIAAGVLVALYYWGTQQPAPALQEPASPAVPLSVSLFEPEEPVSPASGLENTVSPDTAEPDDTAASPVYSSYEVIAEEDGFRIARVQGKLWRGLVAEVTDPSLLTVGTCGAFGTTLSGKSVGDMADSYGAILAVNGGEFSDDGGTGTGGMPVGVILVDGEVLWGGAGHTVGMDYNGKLYAGWYSASGCRDMGMKWALSYGPTLVMNGVVQTGLTDYLREPRTAIGQREDGTVLILTIAGRQPAALGLTCQELAELMQSLGCVNAGNLDGGASSYMYYRGEYLNISNTGGSPRPIPTTLLLMPAAADGEG